MHKLDVFRKGVDENISCLRFDAGDRGFWKIGRRALLYTGILSEFMK